MPKNSSNSPSRTIDATNTACTILEALQTLGGAGVTELANHLNIPKSVAHSHLATLQENDFVVKEHSEYRLGLRFLDFGKYVQRANPVYEDVRGYIRELADDSGELAHFAVEEQGRCVFLVREEGEHAVTITTSRTGRREYLHCTAVGKAILAFAERNQVETILDQQGLPSVTNNTITDRDVLSQELESIQEQGVAIDYEERVKGFRGVAAPVCNEDENILGAVSISGPVSRFTEESLEGELQKLVVDAANVIEVTLTYG